MVELKFTERERRPLVGYIEYVRRMANNLEPNLYDRKEKILFNYNLALWTIISLAGIGLEKLLQQ